jgi:2-succinyl-5-enolpyruvyl-6-hydroxy-3-cyclohexene-1-carboxylate synthase
VEEFQVAQAAWSRTLLRSLAAVGVTHFVVSPGSRSTPLVAALQTLELPFDVVVDERSAGFFALGRAKLSGVPSVLICTSGSAPGHYLPALIEADESDTPLIVLSADRPPELQGNRSAQTIEQRHLLSAKVRWADDLGVPDASDSGLCALRRKAAQAVHRTRYPRPGPVHLNAPLKKPLEPAEPPPAAELVVAATPPPKHFAPTLEPSAAGIDALYDLAQGARRPLLVAGPFAPSNSPSLDVVSKFARTSGWPLLLETTSNLRFGLEHGEARVFDAFDSVFRVLAHVRATGLRDALAPDFVLQLGDTPTSSSFVKVTRGISKAVLTSAGPPDPTNDVQLCVHGNVELGLTRLTERFERAATAHAKTAAGSAYSERLRRANELAWQVTDALSVPPALDMASAGGDESFDHEGQCTRVLGRMLRANDLLVVGNSLPVRLVDTFIRSSSSRIQVLSQRGANGIDGLIAGATGAALGRLEPTFLLLGDISFLHDIGSLACLRQCAPHLTVVVFNNRGGRLFEQLPIAESAGTPDLAPWLTPHRFDLSLVSAAFGIPSTLVGTAEAFEAALELARKARRPHVIEVQTAPSGTHTAYQELERRLEDALLAENWDGL